MLGVVPVGVVAGVGVGVFDGVGVVVGLGVGLGVELGAVATGTGFGIVATGVGFGVNTTGAGFGAVTTDIGKVTTGLGAIATLTGTPNAIAGFLVKPKPDELPPRKKLALIFFAAPAILAVGAAHKSLACNELTISCRSALLKPATGGLSAY